MHKYYIFSMYLYHSTIHMFNNENNPTIYTIYFYKYLTPNSADHNNRYVFISSQIYNRKIDIVPQHFLFIFFLYFLDVRIQVKLPLSPLKTF